MTIGVDVEIRCIGRIAFEIDLGIAVVRIAIFDLNEAAFGHRVFDAGTDAVAVGIDILIEVLCARSRADVVLGVGVAALGVDQQIRLCQHADARAEVEVAAGVDIAETEAFEIAIVEFDISGRAGVFCFRTKHEAARVEVVTDGPAVDDALDRLIVVDR